MNSFKKKNFWLQTALVAVSFLVLTGMGKCGGGEKSKIANCVDAPANKCAEYKQTSDGARCELDTALNKCRAKAGKAPAGACAKNNENDCKDSIKCTWNTSASPAVCVDAPSVILDTCLAYERKEGCDGKLDGKGQTCEWDAAATPAHCKVNTRGAKSKYYSYEFGTFEKPFFPSTDADLVASSKDHSHFYIGTEAGIAVSDDNGASWASVTKLKVGRPSDGKDKVDFSGDRPTLYEPLDKGLIMQNSKGYAIIDKKDMIAAWTFAVGDLAGKAEPATSFAEIKKTDGTLWIYATAANTPEDGVAFQDPTDLKDKWEKVVKTSGNLVLGQLYTALGQAPNGAMYMASKQGIYVLLNAQIGVNGGRMDSVEGSPKYTSAFLAIDGGKPNDASISAITMVDNTYVIVGFKLAKNGGGTGFINLTTGAWTYLVAAKDSNVLKIIPSADNKSAMILSDKGLVIFKNGAYVEVIPGQPLITLALVNNPNNASSFAKDSPKTGFKGGLAGIPNQGAMEMNGKWYFGTSAGVVSLEIKEQEL